MRRFFYKFKYGVQSSFFSIVFLSALFFSVFFSVFLSPSRVYSFDYPDLYFSVGQFSFEDNFTHQIFGQQSEYGILINLFTWHGVSLQTGYFSWETKREYSEKNYIFRSRSFPLRMAYSIPIGKSLECYVGGGITYRFLEEQSNHKRFVYYTQGATFFGGFNWAVFQSNWHLFGEYNYQNSRFKIVDNFNFNGVAYRLGVGFDF